MVSKHIALLCFVLTLPLVSCDSTRASVKESIEDIRKTDRYEVVRTEDLTVQTGVFRLDRQTGEICLIVFSKAKKGETPDEPFVAGCTGSDEK